MGKTASMRRFLRRVVIAATVTTLLAAAACSDDSEPSGSSVASSAGSLTSSSSSSSVSPPTSSPPSCEAAAVPASAVAVTTAEGDYNADGASDTMTVYGTGTASAPLPYRLNVELGDSEGRVDVSIPDAIDDSVRVQVLGSAEITASAGLPPDGSGEELFVQVGSGASASLVGVYQLVDCSLTRLQPPEAFAIGGSVTHLGGLRCDGSAGGQRLVQMSALSDDGITYSTTEQRLEVHDGVFVVTNTINDAIAASDPRLQDFTSINCPGVASP